ncbi:T9SS type A sorting domain-containing protein [candidate division KSB1 bacterium]|nr:T9SS type A sorting domain-containing protein [candidate division KSB1 bacterium]
MVRVCWVLCLFAETAYGSDWTGASWERILETDNGYYASIRGLACRADTNYLVLGIDSEPNGIVDRYECWKWYPYGLSPVSLPNPVTMQFRDLNYDSVDRARAAFLTDRTLFRQRGADWDSLDLSENDFTVRPQCFCFDSLGTLHFGALTSTFTLRYSRRGGGRAARDQLFDDPFVWGWADRNAARIIAPAGDQVTLFAANQAGGPSIAFRSVYAYSSRGEQLFTSVETAVDSRWKPQLLASPGVEWIYGLERGHSANRRMLVIHGRGLNVDAVELPVDTLIREFSFAWNPAGQTFEAAMYIESTNPREIRVLERVAGAWTPRHDAETPSRVDGVHCWIDAAGRGHLIVCDSTTLWYYGPPAGVGGRNGVPMPQSPQLEAYPNPFNGTVRIRLESLPPGDVQVDVFDIAGRSVYSRRVKASPGGTELKWSAGEQASGIYFVRATAGSFRSVRKLVLLK